MIHGKEKQQGIELRLVGRQIFKTTGKQKHTNIIYIILYSVAVAQLGIVNGGIVTATAAIFFYTTLVPKSPPFYTSLYEFFPKISNKS